MMTIALNWPLWICLKSPEGQPAGNSRDETGITTPVEHKEHAAGAAVCVSVCVGRTFRLPWDTDLGCPAGYHGDAVLLSLAVKLSTHTPPLGRGRLRGHVYKKSRPQSHHREDLSFSCGRLLLPLPLGAAPPPGDGQLSQIDLRQEPVSTRRMQD